MKPSNKFYLPIVDSYQNFTWEILHPMLKWLPGLHVYTYTWTNIFTVYFYVHREIMRHTKKPHSIQITRHFATVKREAKSKKLKKSTFPLLPLLRHLRRLGVIPFGEDNSGLTFSLLSWPMLYCSTMSTVQMFLSQSTAANGSFYYGLFNGFDQFIRSSMGLIYVGYVIFSPIMWPSTPAVVRAVNKWSRLQEQLDRMSVKGSSPILFRHPGRCLLLVISIAATEQVISFKGVRFRIALILTFLFAMQTYMMFTWFWIVFSYTVSRNSENLKRSLSMAVRGRGTEVRRHRELWEQLWSHTRQLVDAVASSVLTWLVFRLMIIVLSLYASAVYKLRNHGSNAMPTYLFIPFLRSMLDLVIACECSHRADLKMRRDFKLTILSLKFQSLPVDTQDELELFLCSLDRSGYVFSLQGVLELNRETLLSITSLTLTYITVLVQLKQLPLFN